LKKIRNSGELASISAHVAYDKDQFEYELGDNENIVHKPFLGEDRGKPVAVYAVAKTKDGAIYREVMSVSDVEKVRAASRAGKFGPWVDWWDEMAKKTVIRRMAKRLPSSADVDSVLANDLEASGFTQQAPQAPINITPVPEAQQAPLSRLKASMGQPAGEAVDMATGEITQEEVANVPTADA
jgi:recombination protein RecT